MDITHEDYLLLRFLNAYPRSTFSELANYFNTSVHTIKRKIEKLKRTGMYNGYYAIYSPEAIGLNRFFVFLVVANTKDLFYVEKALDVHPYTIHRARFYSPKIGIFAQFDIPTNNEKLLSKYFDILKEKGYITSYQILKSIGIRKRKTPDFSRFIWNSLNWSYDWEEFKKQINAPLPISIPQRKNLVINEMKEIDFKILSKITVNAEIHQRELSRQLKVNRTSIWRRMNFLNQHVIVGFNAKIRRSIFKLTANSLYILKFRKLKELLSIYNGLSNEISPPFSYNVEIVKDKNEKNALMVYISMPPYHESQFVYSIADYAYYQMFNLDISGSNSVRYGFYADSFDWQDKKWKYNPFYVIEEPLIQLQNVFSS